MEATCFTETSHFLWTTFRYIADGRNCHDMGKHIIIRHYTGETEENTEGNELIHCYKYSQDLFKLETTIST
jgi:hypothetical protein